MPPQRTTTGFPPETTLAELSESVESDRSSVPELKMPPPKAGAEMKPEDSESDELSVSVEADRSSVPSLTMPPPVAVASPLSIVTPETLAKTPEEISSTVPLWPPSRVGFVTPEAGSIVTGSDAVVLGVDSVQVPTYELDEPGVARKTVAPGKASESAWLRLHSSVGVD